MTDIWAMYVFALGSSEKYVNDRDDKKWLLGGLNVVYNVWSGQQIYTQVSPA